MASSTGLKDKKALRLEALSKLLFFSLLSFIMLVLEPRFAGFSVVRTVVNYGLTPLHLVVEQVTRISDASTLLLGNRLANLQTISFLQRENLQLKAQLSNFNELQRINQHLRQLLQYKEGVNTTQFLEVARVIGGQTNVPLQELILDLGHADGLVPGMIVRSHRGLIGQIILVGAASSKTLAITDSRHSVPVRVARSGDRFILDGNGQDNSLSSYDIPANIRVRAGDLLLTSGLGGVFPSGIPVAEVVEVTRKERVSLRDVQAVPLAQPQAAEFVLVAAGLEFSELSIDAE